MRGDLLNEYDPEMPLYICDPNRAVSCDKDGCQGRFHCCERTTHPEWAKLDDSGNPIIADTWESWTKKMYEEEKRKRNEFKETHPDYVDPWGE